MMKAIIIDDHRMTALSLAESLTARGVEVLAVKHAAPAGIETIGTHDVDVVVTDLDLGLGPTGIDIANHTQRNKPRVGVVLLTAYEDPKLLDTGIPAVSREVVYVVKQQLARIDTLLASMELAVAYATGVQKPPPGHQFPLSDAQAKVLRLVAQGLSNQAIATELVMSVESVQTSIKRLARTFGIKRDSETNLRVALTQRFFELIGYGRER
jgi:DNA-binding NarL/FixJ family response regulator